MSGKCNLVGRLLRMLGLLVVMSVALASCTGSTPEKVVEFSVDGAATMARPLGEPFMGEFEEMVFSLGGPDSYSFDVKIKNPNDVPIAVEVSHSAYNTQTFVDDILTTQSVESEVGQELHQSYDHVIYKLEPGEDRTVVVRIEPYPHTLGFMISFVADDSELWIKGMPVSSK